MSDTHANAPTSLEDMRTVLRNAKRERRLWASMFEDDVLHAEELEEAVAAADGAVDAHERAKRKAAELWDTRTCDRWTSESAPATPAFRRLLRAGRKRETAGERSQHTVNTLARLVFVDDDDAAAYPTPVEILAAAKESLAWTHSACDDSARVLQELGSTVAIAEAAVDEMSRARKAARDLWATRTAERWVKESAPATPAFQRLLHMGREKEAACARACRATHELAVLVDELECL